MRVVHFFVIYPQPQYLLFVTTRVRERCAFLSLLSSRFLPFLSPLSRHTSDQHGRARSYKATEWLLG